MTSLVRNSPKTVDKGMGKYYNTYMSKRQPSEILSFIRRQKTVKTPNRAYINWLLRQYRLTCEVTVIKGKK